jgi:DNA polymerase-3 subunit gamma/tau
VTYQVLARKWRPRTFAEVVGQGHVLKALINALDSDRLHHAYLFTGTRGVGKTTLARVLAKALNCDRGVSSRPCGECASCQEIDQGRCVDLIEVDAASRTKVDETRELLDNVPYAPTRARYKVYLIDEVHMFSNHSFNALLKTLEEPPPHVKFLLATTDPKRLPVTILSRCLQFNLTRLPTQKLADHLAHVLEAEGVAADAGAVQMIAQAAGGSVRDALSLVDQAIAHGGGNLLQDEVASMLGTVDQDRVLKLLEVVVGTDAHQVIAHARDLAQYAPDYAQVLGELASLLRRVAVAQATADAAREFEHDERVLALAARVPAEDCQLLYQIALTARRDLAWSAEPEGAFEMSLLRMVAFRPLAPPTVALPEAVSATASPLATAVAAIPSAATARAAAATAAPPPRPAAPTAPATFDWARTVDELNLVGLARELARNSALVNFDGVRLELAIAPQFERLAARRHVDNLSAALGERLGRAIQLKVAVVAGDGFNTPSQLEQAAAQARQRQAEDAIAQDPTVQALRDAFDATIEDVSER